MFGRAPIVNVFESRGPSHVSLTKTVHEHRAPTEQSVALLREMEAAALSKIVQAVRLDGNGFECEIQQYRDHETMGQTLLAIFDLNGRRMTAKVVARCASAEDGRQLPAKLRDEIARIIATEVLSDAFRCVQFLGKQK